MVTHNIDSVIDHATHIVCLKNTPIFIGEKKDFLNTEYAKLNKIGQEE